MVGVVRGHMARELFYGDPPALRMYSIALPLFRSEPVEHTQIGFPQETEHIESVLRRPGIIIPEPRPFVLIEPRQSSAAALDHLAVAPTADKFILRHVSENRTDRPLARRGPMAKHFVRLSFDQASKSLRSLALHCNRILVLNVCGEPGFVLLCGFARHWTNSFLRLTYLDTMCHMRYSSDMATHRTTVNISITPELDAFIQNRVKSGRYQTTSEVVREALRLLERHERERDEAFRKLKAKLKRGAGQAERSELIDGDEVFDELREMIEERRRAKATGQ